MAYFLIIGGIVLVVAAARNTQGCLLTLLQSDLVNTNTALASSPCALGKVSNTSSNFVWWFLSIFIIGAIGYVQRLRPISDAFLTLVLVVLFIDNKGFFNQFVSAINTIKGGLGTTAIGNASSAGVSVAVDTVPDNQVSDNETVVTGGTTITTGGGSTTGGSSSCPPGYTYLDSQCVPIDYFGGGTTGDPTGTGDPSGGEDYLPALPKLGGL